ncbi:MAG: hypothetical protein ABIO46_07705 [Chitinophagales bacterium]
MEPNNLNSTDRAMITAAFSNKESAERAYQTLEERGYTKDEINVLMSDDTRKKYFKHEEHPTDLGNKAMEGAGKGSAIGGTLGAIAGVIAAIGTSVLIPGLGLVIAGPLAAGLAGAGAGGVAGGLIGALVGSGIPEDRAKEYERAIKNGHIVMGVRPRTDDDAVHINREWVVSKDENV